MKAKKDKKVKVVEEVAEEDKKPYCGYRDKLTKNKRFGTMKECAEEGAVSRYGRYKLDPVIGETVGLKKAERQSATKIWVKIVGLKARLKALKDSYNYPKKSDEDKMKLIPEIKEVKAKLDELREKRELALKAKDVKETKKEKKQVKQEKVIAKEETKDINKIKAKLIEDMKEELKIIEPQHKDVKKLVSEHDDFLKSLVKMTGSKETAELIMEGHLEKMKNVDLDSLIKKLQESVKFTPNKATKKEEKLKEENIYKWIKAPNNMSEDERDVYNAKRFMKNMMHLTNNEILRFTHEKLRAIDVNLNTMLESDDYYKIQRQNRIEKMIKEYLAKPIVKKKLDI